MPTPDFVRDGWDHRLPCAADYASSDDLQYTSDQVSGIAPHGEMIHNFVPRKGKQKPRRAWSTVAPDDPIHADLRRAYTLLWNSKTDARLKMGLLHQAQWHAAYCDGTDSDVHTNWLFLPWHRAFVYFHELILGHMIGKPDLRLPYWDWEAGHSAIPSFYLDLGMPNFLTGTCLRKPAPKDEFPITPCLLQAWLWSTRFEDFCGASSPRPVGQAPNGPHTIVHDDLVGGAMGTSRWAAADPSFFAHHANIDRYWNYWMGCYPNFREPAQSKAWENFEFYFYDEQNRLIRVTPKDVLHSDALKYFYEDAPESFPSLNLLPSSLSDVWQDSTKLYQELLGVLAGALQNPSSLMQALSSGVNAVTDLWKKYMPSLPIQMRVEIPTQALTPGQYNLVQIARGPSNSMKYSTLGGFGVFNSHAKMSQHPTTQIAVMGCLQPDIIDVLLHGDGPIRLQWGPAKASNLNTMEITEKTKSSFQFQFLYPAAYAAAKKAFSVLPLHL